jgi:hypothetical protein
VDESTSGAKNEGEDGTVYTLVGAAAGDFVPDARLVRVLGAGNVGAGDVGAGNVVAGDVVAGDVVAGAERLLAAVAFSSRLLEIMSSKVDTQRVGIESAPI